VKVNESELQLVAGLASIWRIAELSGLDVQEKGWIKRQLRSRMARDYLEIYRGLPGVGVGAVQRPRLLPPAEAGLEVAA
jgi:hypothetical protein